MNISPYNNKSISFENPFGAAPLEKPNLTQLPNELLETIVSHLGIPDRRNLCLTSKLFRKITLDQTVFQTTMVKKKIVEFLSQRISDPQIMEKFASLLGQAAVQPASLAQNWSNFETFKKELRDVLVQLPIEKLQVVYDEAIKNPQFKVFHVMLWQLLCLVDQKNPPNPTEDLKIARCVAWVNLLMQGSLTPAESMLSFEQLKGNLPSADQMAPVNAAIEALFTKCINDGWHGSLWLELLNLMTASDNKDRLCYAAVGKYIGMNKFNEAYQAAIKITHSYQKALQMVAISEACIDQGAIIEGFQVLDYDGLSQLPNLKAQVVARLLATDHVDKALTDLARSRLSNLSILPELRKQLLGQNHVEKVKEIDGILNPTAHPFPVGGLLELLATSAEKIGGEQVNMPRAINELVERFKSGESGYAFSTEVSRLLADKLPRQVLEGLVEMFINKETIYHSAIMHKIKEEVFRREVLKNAILFSRAKEIHADFVRKEEEYAKAQEYKNEQLLPLFQHWITNKHLAGALDVAEKFSEGEDKVAVFVTLLTRFRDVDHSDVVERLFLTCQWRSKAFLAIAKNHVSSGDIEKARALMGKISDAADKATLFGCIFQAKGKAATRTWKWVMKKVEKMSTNDKVAFTVGLAEGMKIGPEILGCVKKITDEQAKVNCLVAIALGKAYDKSCISQILTYISETDADHLEKFMASCAQAPTGSRDSLFICFAQWFVSKGRTGEAARALSKVENKALVADTLLRACAEDERTGSPPRKRSKLL